MERFRNNQPNNMDYGVKNIEVIFEGFVVLIVFGISFFTPLVISRMALGVAMDAVIRIELNNIRNWGEIYKLKNGNYGGLNNDKEIKRIGADIKIQGGRLSLFENKTNYCAKSKLRNGFWCVDDSGYGGSGYSNCADKHYRCR